MKQKEIDNLIEKYMNGVSSGADEKKIKQYLSENSELSEEHQALKMMFDYYEAEQSISTELSIDDIVKSKYSVGKRLIVKILSVAAAVLLFVMLLLFQDNKPDKQIYAYINGKAITNKEIAVAETKKALLAVSNNFNVGSKNMLYLKKIDEVQSLIRNE